MRLIPARGTLSMGMAISEPPALLQGLPAAGRANSLDGTQRSSCGLVDLLTFKCPAAAPEGDGLSHSPTGPKPTGSPAAGQSQAIPCGPALRADKPLIFHSRRHGEAPPYGHSRRRISWKF